MIMWVGDGLNLLPNPGWLKLCGYVHGCSVDNSTYMDGIPSRIISEVDFSVQLRLVEVGTRRLQTHAANSLFR